MVEDNTERAHALEAVCAGIGDPTEILVETYSANGTPVDSHFSLIVP